MTTIPDRILFVKKSFQQELTLFVEKKSSKNRPDHPVFIFDNRKNYPLMDDEKKMQFVLTLSDIAEGLGTVMESLKLIANGLDDVANLLRDTVQCEETSS